MIGKEIDKIEEKDLQNLIDNQVLEHKTIEYKASLPGKSPSEAKEFLADVSSFANASGGDIIFGITEDRDTGLPKAVEGLAIENVDQKILRLENMIRDGIEPRIPGKIIQPVKLSNSKTALVIRIQKSWISPHRVIFNKDYQFHSRHSNGKYPLDVGELRIAFNLSETIAERIRKFREDRISKIYANETPVPFCDNPKIVLHLIPIISFNPAQIYKISHIASHPEKIIPMHCAEVNCKDRYNFDGFMTHNNRNGKAYSYVQLFKNGIIEAVEGHSLDKPGQIYPLVYEKELIKSFHIYLSTLKELNIELPIFAFLALLGVSGYSRIFVDQCGFPSLTDEGHPIDRDILLLQEIVIESYDIIPEIVLRPCFDSIWNACGFSRSLNYNEAGEWVGMR